MAKNAIVPDPFVKNVKRGTLLCMIPTFMQTFLQIQK